MEGTNHMLHKLRALGKSCSRLRGDRGATDPMLAIGAVVLTLILVLGGTFLITNMVTSGRNLNATTDLDKIAVAESGYFTANDTFAAYGSFGRHAPREPLEDSSIGFRPTYGASVVAIIDKPGGEAPARAQLRFAEWAAASESAANGNPVFIRTSESNRTVKYTANGVYDGSSTEIADLAEIGISSSEANMLVAIAKAEK